jgi:2-dehydro-3-deoxyphosphogluconate aldolase / (4S)-4-hydroxy-2-oxoglutarate aldolase
VAGPTLNTEISRLCNRQKIAYTPVCQTVNEISEAEEFGAEIIKIFPGKTFGGPDFIEDVLGHIPCCRLIPTCGFEPVKESITVWIQAGAAAARLGIKLIRKEWLDAQNYQEMGELVSAVIGWAREAAGK